MKNPRIPRKPGQPAGSDKHSDLFTDENPKGTIHGLGFKDEETAKRSVSKIKNSGKTHAHKTQAAIAMEQRARTMNKTREANVYRAFIEEQKKITKEKTASVYPLIAAAGGYGLGRNFGKTDKQKHLGGATYGSILGLGALAGDVAATGALEDLKTKALSEHLVSQKPVLAAQEKRISDFYNYKRFKRARRINKAIRKEMRKREKEVKKLPPSVREEALQSYKKMLMLNRDTRLDLVDIEKAEKILGARNRYRNPNIDKLPTYIKGSRRINAYRKGIPLALGGLGAYSVIKEMKNKQKARRRK